MCTKCKIRPQVKYKNSHNSWCRKCINIYIREYKEIKLGYPSKRDFTKKPYYKERQILVYGYFTSDGQAIYIGRGSKNRAFNHKYSSPWWNKDLTILTMTCFNEWEAMEMEGRWGGRYLPIMNKEGYRYG